MHVLVAPDKFKGSLSAAEAGAALGAGWRDGWPAQESLEIEYLLIADDGEGTAEAITMKFQSKFSTRSFGLFKVA